MERTSCIRKIINFFKKKDNSAIAPGSLYGISTGKYLGECFVYIERDKDNLYFLSLPRMEIRKVPEEKFNIGLLENILEFQKVLPKKIRKVCIEQYQKNAKKSNS